MAVSWCAHFIQLHVALASAVINGPETFQEQRRQEPKQWGLLVAGSNGYFNYRHQADVCHAYQVLHHHGIPDEQIVVMMYDDIANNSLNPTKGTILNHPNGKDVYAGVPKDYTGNSVTPENFLRVLQGIDPGVGSHKVIKSGKQDHVFVYFSDHGAPGMLIFPDAHLHARRLINVITEMHSKEQYGKMVFFVEACFSGSMFDTLLPKNISVYAMTAAHAHELSYACYYDTFRDVWLGDSFSVYWMEYADQENLHKQTLHHLYNIVQHKTTKSHVMQYGDMTTAKAHMSEFMGEENATRVVYLNISCDSVSSAQAPIHGLEHKINTTENSTLKSELKHLRDDILAKREEVAVLFMNIVDTLDADSSAIYTKPAVIEFECYENVTDVFSTNCLQLSKNPFAVTQFFVLVNLCTNYSAEIIVETLKTVCINLNVTDVI